MKLAGLFIVAGSLTLIAGVNAQEIGFEGTSAELYSQYKDNSVAFKRKVKNKDIVVTGELRDIKEDDKGNISLQMPGSEMVSWVDIKMNKDQEDKVLELKTGQKATVACKKIEKVFELELSDCVMKESAASSNTQITKIDNEYMTAVLNSDVAIGDVKDVSSEDFPVQGFKQRFEFSIPEVAPKGGQMFVCNEKKDCDPIFAYYDSLKGLAGPFLYQSPKGVVVLQLNSGLKEETAKKLEKAISGF